MNEGPIYISNCVQNIQAYACLNQDFANIKYVTYILYVIKRGDFFMYKKTSRLSYNSYYSETFFLMSHILAK